MSKIIAAFDFDCTLSDRDSLVPFLWNYFPRVEFFLKMIYCAPYGFLYLIKMISNSELKRRVLGLFFAGMEEEDLVNRAREYAEKDLSGLVREKALAKMKWHKDQDHECIIVSASMELYLKPWGKNVGFDDVLGTKIDFSGVNPKMLKNCYGPEKVVRLKKKYGEDKDYILYAYGDSVGDKELLDYADHPHYQVF
ncbi:Protein CicA [Chlamydiales bacterium SCGC AG-110-M15]|nr:Protein CicA [Chlamydiales bacterium SCGC AG-110-M15]